jgi:hypothetical protein
MGYRVIERQVHQMLSTYHVLLWKMVLAERTLAHLHSMNQVKSSRVAFLLLLVRLVWYDTKYAILSHGIKPKGIELPSSSLPDT